MNFDDYRTLAMRTCPKLENSDKLLNAALGLAGEAGEFADIVKKISFQGHAMDIEKLADEVGDILWYCALASKALNRTLGEIALNNVEKLVKRYPNGFERERSVNRQENIIWRGEEHIASS